jgi:cyclic beta-1,2-glucan synthetase
MKQLAVDLVILNERAPSYVQDLQALLETLVRTSQSAAAHDGHAPHGSVYILRSDRITALHRDALLTVARAVLSNRRGALAEQITREQRPEIPSVAPLRRPPATKPMPDLPLPRPELDLFNGLGGRRRPEYVTILEAGQSTPAPWINVISNPAFGFQVSESGSGYTWSINSRENQLTPWSNDPVNDPPGEAIYVRDEESGELWSPTALPIREAGQPYAARHGQGYSRFEHVSHGISLELLQFVPLGDPIKVSRLTVRNDSGRRRRLSVTAYVEWVLGVSRSASAPFIVTEIDPDTKAMHARNTWASDFGGRVAFADLGGAQTAWTGDRTEFLGRNGALERPAALIREGRLSGRVGPSLDPCGALQTIVELRAGERADVVFFLGETATREEAGALIARYRTADLDMVLRAVELRWDELLGAVQVRTPDRSMDLLLNRWLLYQTLACRV